jgi:hypothetical protein
LRNCLTGIGAFRSQSASDWGKDFDFSLGLLLCNLLCKLQDVTIYLTKLFREIVIEHGDFGLISAIFPSIAKAVCWNWTC